LSLLYYICEKWFNPERVKFTGTALFVLSSLWFYLPGEYVLIANQDLTLFITTPGYLLSFLDRPGGLLDYFGSFLSQFFRFRFAGALLLAGVITTGYYAAGALCTSVTGKKESLVIGILTPMLLLGMHNYYPHQVSHSLGFILAIGLAAATPAEGVRKWVFLGIALPLSYIVSGGFVWVFSGLVLAGGMVRRSSFGYTTVLITVLYPALIIACGARWVYLDPLRELMTISLPFGPAYGASPWPFLFVGWIFLFVILAGVPDPFQNARPVWRRWCSVAICLVGMVLVLHFSYNRKNHEFFQIEKRAIRGDWDGLLHYADQHPSMNLFGSFYTNLALVNSGRVCTDLFRYPQAFGRRGLCFNWEAKGEILRRGSDFFWTIHFVNEAHHWAFESVVIDGFTRRNTERLIQTELVRGNDKVAEKYIRLLRSALFHRKMADHYAGFLYNREAVENSPELGPVLHTLIENDFFSEGMDLETNLRMLLANTPSNRPAYDYLMALLLLEKEVDQLAASLPGYLKANGGVSPNLLDEALLVYQVTHRNEELSTPSVTPVTMERFEAYTRILRQHRDPKEAARMLYPAYRNSFWYYLNFTPSPNS
jgi:hypothetical protein